MKFLTFAFLACFLSSALWAQDFKEQTISDEGQAEVRNLSATIKNYLRNAINEESKRSSLKHKIFMNPALYDTAAIQNEWDEILAELRAGKFCRGCGKSKKEYDNSRRPNDLDFETHAANNGGTEPVSQNKLDEVNTTYSKKYSIAKDVNEAYALARSERANSVWAASNLTKTLHNKIQLAYDFQLRVYFSLKKNAKEITFKNLADLLIAQDIKVAQTSPEDANYKEYRYQRLTTAEKMDENLIELNNKRLKILKTAEDKKAESLTKISEIRELARQTGEDEVPSASITEQTFVYNPLKDTYLVVRVPERMENLVNSATLMIYKKTKE